MLVAEEARLDPEAAARGGRCHQTPRAAAAARAACRADRARAGSPPRARARRVQPGAIWIAPKLLNPAIRCRLSRSLAPHGHPDFVVAHGDTRWKVRHRDAGHVIRLRSIRQSARSRGVAAQMPPAPAATVQTLECTPEFFVGRETGRGLPDPTARRLRAVVVGDDEVMVSDPPAAAERLRELYAEGAITGGALNRLGAFAWFGDEGLHPRTTQRRAAELRGLGLALNPHEGGGATAPVGVYLRAFVSTWAA